MFDVQNEKPAVARLDRSFPKPPDGGNYISGRSTAILVWGAWLLLLVVAFAAVAVHGRNLPFAEDWYLVGPLTGNEPRLLAWVWAQNSEHLVPVPKLVYLVLLKLGGGDFRAGMVFNTAVLGALAAGMILVARRLRGGRSRATDAVFPLLFLHLGHWDNLLWGWQMQFVLSTAFACVLLLMLVAWRDGPATPAAAGAAAVCVLSLPLSGGNGVIVAPAFALWLLYCGVGRVRRSAVQPAARLAGAILIAASVLALLLVATYLLRYERLDWYPASPSLRATVETSLKFVAFGVGPAAQRLWLVATVAVLGVLAFAGVVLLRGVASSEASERRRAVGLLVLAGALTALAFAMGWGRAGKVEASGYMSTRYALLSVPLLCAAYFIVELYGRRTGRLLSHGLLLLLALGLLPLNTRVGMQRRDWFQRGFDSFQTDLQTGMPLTMLADRHHPFLMPWNRDGLYSGMQMLRDACIGPLAQHQEAVLPNAAGGGCPAN